MRGPHCPRCQHEFPYRFAFKWWNPYKFNCPACGATLKVFRVTLLLLLSGALGAMMALVAITMEILHVWTTGGSLLFFVIGGPIIIVPSHVLVWRRERFILHNVT